MEGYKRYNHSCESNEARLSYVPQYEGHKLISVPLASFRSRPGCGDRSHGRSGGRREIHYIVTAVITVTNAAGLQEANEEGRCDLAKAVRHGGRRRVWLLLYSLFLSGQSITIRIHK